jgi:tetratricopeptide (TPR) repeat protein
VDAARRDRANVPLMALGAAFPSRLLAAHAGPTRLVDSGRRSSDPSFMHEVWSRVGEGKHVVVVGTLPPPPEAEGEARWVVVRVGCDGPWSTWGPLEDARRRIEALLGEQSPRWDEALDRMGTTARLLGDLPEPTVEAMLVGAANRLVERHPGRAALVVEGLDTADEATVQQLRDIVGREGWLRLPLVLGVQRLPDDGALAELALAIGSVSLVIEASAEAAPSFDWPSLGTEVLLVMRAAAVVGRAFEVELVARLLGVSPDAVLVRLQQAADQGAPLTDQGGGRFVLPEPAHRAIVQRVLPSLVERWHRRLGEILAEPASPSLDADVDEPRSDSLRSPGSSFESPIARGARATIIPITPPRWEPEDDVSVTEMDVDDMELRPTIISTGFPVPRAGLLGEDAPTGEGSAKAPGDADPAMVSEPSLSAVAGSISAPDHASDAAPEPEPTSPSGPAEAARPSAPMLPPPVDPADLTPVATLRVSTNAPWLREASPDETLTYGEIFEPTAEERLSSHRPERPKTEPTPAFDPSATMRLDPEEYDRLLGAARDQARAAHHLSEAGLPERAVEQYLAALRKVAARGDSRRALLIADQALVLLDRQPPSRARDVLHARVLAVAARVQWRGAGRGPELTLQGALESLDHAEQLVGADGPLDLRTEIAQLVAGVCYDLGDISSLQRALDALTDAARGLMAAGEAVLAARLLNDQAAVYLRAGDPVRANHLLQQSRRVFDELHRERPDDPTVIVERAETEHLLARLPLHARLRAGREDDAYSLALGHARSAAEGYRRLGGRVELGRVSETMGRLETARGRHERALEHLDMALRTSRELGDMIGLARSTAALAELYIAAGRPAEALGALRESVAFNVDKGSPLGLAVNRRTLESLRRADAADPRRAPALVVAILEVEDALARAEAMLGRVSVPGDTD